MGVRLLKVGAFYALTLANNFPNAVKFGKQLVGISRRTLLIDDHYVFIDNQ